MSPSSYDTSPDYGLGSEYVPRDVHEELRDLFASVLRALVLKGHIVTSKDWERLLLLTGHYCEPFISCNPLRDKEGELSQ